MTPVQIGWANEAEAIGVPRRRVHLASRANVPVPPFGAGVVVAQWDTFGVPLFYSLGVPGTEDYVATWFNVFNVRGLKFPFGIDVQPDR